MSLYFLPRDAIQIPPDLLFTGYAEKFTVRLNQSLLAVFPLAEWPVLSRFKDQLAEEEIADWSVEILEKRRLAMQENQFGNVGTNVTGALVHMAVRMSWYATTNFTNHGKGINAIGERYLNEKSIDLLAFVRNRKTATKKRLVVPDDQPKIGITCLNTRFELLEWFG